MQKEEDNMLPRSKRPVFSLFEKISMFAASLHPRNKLSLNLEQEGSHPPVSKAKFSQSSNKPFFRKLSFIFIFFSITPIALITSMFALFTINTDVVEPIVNTESSIYISPPRGVQVYASLPSDSPSVSAEIGVGDARIVLIQSFMEANDSPMAPHSEFIVNISDKYGLDFRLTTAIAMKESGLGKAMPNDDCNNAWGYGIHSAGTLCFDSWQEGIDKVSRGLKENYYDLGLVTPTEIMSKWIPHSPGGLWAVHVEQYMNKLN